MDSDPKSILELPSDKILTYTFTLVSLIIPGMGYLYLTKYDLFLTIDIVRLILLSIFYSLPLYITGIFAVAADKREHKDKFVRVMWGASSFALIFFYLSIGLAVGYNALFSDSLLFEMYGIAAFFSGIFFVYNRFFRK